MGVVVRLLEREAELGEVAQAVAAASVGAGRLLVIEGPAGIGKTRLLAATRELAEQAGMEVLRARGGELEREFSYGMVRQLFEPILARVEPGQREELLAGSAGMAGRLFGVGSLEGMDGGDSSYATLHGLFWLAANVASARPLLLALDDLHWADTSSLRWLDYLVRRLDGLPVLVAVGLRPAEPGADARLLSGLLTDPDAVVCRPGALSPPAAALLVRELLGPDAEDAFCAACHETTGGNPLLLRQLVSALASEGVPPRADQVSRVREIGPQAVARAVELRLTRLPGDAGALARAVAVLGDGVELGLAATLAGLDRAQGVRLAQMLRRVDILAAPGPLGFVHPVIGAAVYAGLTDVDREEAHAHAAELLVGDGAPVEQIAAHLLLTPPAARDATVATLREAAHGSLARGAPDSAVAYLGRALAEPPAADQRGQALLELGRAEALVDGHAATPHLEEATRLIADPRRRAEIAVLLGTTLFFTYRTDEAVQVFDRGLAELGGVDADLARRLEAGIVAAASMDPRLHAVGAQRLERFRAEDHRDGAGGKMLLALLAYEDARAGVPASKAIPLARQALAGGALLAEQNGGPSYVQAGLVLTLADLDEALDVWEASLAEAHRSGSAFALCAAKVFRAKLFVIRGALAEAESDAREALHLAESWGVALGLAYPAAYLVDALCEQGRLDEAERAITALGFGVELPDDGHYHWLAESRARLRILRGDVGGGLEEMLGAGRRFEALGGRNPAWMAWRSSAALALSALGEDPRARELAREEVELARRWTAAGGLGRALRAHAAVGESERRLERLEEAVDVLRESTARLEYAKALTDLGAELRRSNRRADARDPLRRGLELAFICGATPLVERAKTELAATGARPRRLVLSGPDSLTPSERRVAAMAAEDLTNRDIAQALFVTSKTIEMHLSNAYLKLGIKSRLQLAAALA
jgi:DNA-binding CsgD family transcriptional regulator